MLNMIKMDLYRMFRTKSFYVIWIVMAALVIMTTYMSKIDYDMQEKAAGQEEAEALQTEPETVNLGMTVEIPIEAGEKVTVLDMFFANAQARVVALFLVIFAVLFSTADITSGYIKSIGGQVRDRGSLILSRTVALMVFAALTMVFFVAVQAVSTRIFFGYLEWGGKKAFFMYFGTQLLLHVALMILCMTIAIVIRNNVISMVIVVCLSMNLMVVLYSAVDKLAGKLGIKDFHLIQYTVTGKISMLSVAPGNKECIGALCIAAGFGLVFVTLCSLNFKKRDV